MHLLSLRQWLFLVGSLSLTNKLIIIIINYCIITINWSDFFLTGECDFYRRGDTILILLFDFTGAGEVLPPPALSRCLTAGLRTQEWKLIHYLRGRETQQQQRKQQQTPLRKNIWLSRYGGKYHPNSYSPHPLPAPSGAAGYVCILPPQHSLKPWQGQMKGTSHSCATATGCWMAPLANFKSTSHNCIKDRKHPALPSKPPQGDVPYCRAGALNLSSPSDVFQLDPCTWRLGGIV